MCAHCADRSGSDNLAGAVLLAPPSRGLDFQGQFFHLSQRLSLPSHHRPAHPNFTMSHTPSASTSTPSSNFQLIFYAAVKAYEKKTKKDLLAHPLAAQLQACNSPSDILAVLQDKVNEFDQLRSADERLSQWLNPTINVLYSFSATLGTGVGLVSTVKPTFLLLPLSPISQVWSPASVIFSGIGVLLLVGIFIDPDVEAILTMKVVIGSQRCRSQPRCTH